MKPTLFTLITLTIFSRTLCAQATTYSQPVEADTFVSSGATNANFGTSGAMEIAAPTVAQPRTLLTLLRFDTKGLQSAFDTDFGAGNWTVTAVSLTLFSSVATAGQQPNNASFNRIAAGGFEFDLLGNNNWNETGLTWNTLPSLLPASGNGNTQTSLGTFFWYATGQTSSSWELTPEAVLTEKILSGDKVTILGRPKLGSTVGYLFNTLSLNPGNLNVTATAVPEPSTIRLLAGAVAVAVGTRFFRKKK